MSVPEFYLEPSVLPILTRVDDDSHGQEVSLLEHAECGLPPVFRRGAEMLALRERMLIPICLNNGYYTREKVFQLLLFASRASRQVSIFFTDGPARHNYLAIGKTAKEAERECRRHLNRLRNHCVAAVDKINIDRQTAAVFEVYFNDWNSIYGDSFYQLESRRLLRLYQRDDRFRSDVRRTTQEVLKKKVAVPADSFQSNELELESVVDRAIHYSLEELAFLLTYSKRLDHLEALKAPYNQMRNGTRASFVYVYNQRWPVFENLVDGAYDGNEHREIGFHIVD